LAKSASEYQFYLVESYFNQSKASRHGNIHIRPIKGQGFPDDFGVECSKELINNFEVGTQFRIKAKLKDGGTHLYSHYNSPYEVVEPKKPTPSSKGKSTVGEIEFPFSSYSWIMYSAAVAVKQMDKSAFLHGGTGVPKEILFFFNFDPADERKQISLVHSDKIYNGHLSPDAENQRVRLFWKTPFSKLIEGLMPNQYLQFKNDDSSTLTPAEMRFVKKGDDVYVVDFLKPESIIADVENRDEEPSGTKARKEGAAKIVSSTQYERDPQNRLEAIRIHGHQCVACGFDFGQAYGERGEGYIEIHHLVPLADVDEDHEVNPETDLAPVCSNCHRMIHRRRDDTLSIEKLRKLIQG
jgi:5-methylcytosine-specific restriction enzyme A